MARYRKLPVEIEAVQCTEGVVAHGYAELHEFVGEGFCQPVDESISPYIKTLEGDMIVSLGDYIIKGVNGEFYPCKPDIFEKTYEAVEVCEKNVYSFFWDCGRQGDIEGIFKALRRKTGLRKNGN